MCVRVCRCCVVCLLRVVYCVMYDVLRDKCCELWSRSSALWSVSCGLCALRCALYMLCGMCCEVYAVCRVVCLLAVSCLG